MALADVIDGFLEFLDCSLDLEIITMTQALSLKFDVHGLGRAAAIPLIDDAVSGDDWQYGFTFADGSSMNVRFLSSDTDGVEKCLIDCYDEQGKSPQPVVRTRFTCKYLDNLDSIEAYYDGTTLVGHALPYLTYSDVKKLMSQVSGVRIVGTRAEHRRCLIGFERVFEFLPPGYDWGEHKTAYPFLLDLGCRVIEVYTLSGADWEWMPSYSSDECTIGP